MARGDLISRKQVLKELRAELRDCQKDAAEMGGESILWAEGIEFAIDTVKHIKSADAAPVVRCKDCRFIIARADGTHGCYRHFVDDCNLYDFCSYGERGNNGGM